MLGSLQDTNHLKCSLCSFHFLISCISEGLKQYNSFAGPSVQLLPYGMIVGTHSLESSDGEASAEETAMGSDSGEDEESEGDEEEIEELPEKVQVGCQLPSCCDAFRLDHCCRICIPAQGWPRAAVTCKVPLRSLALLLLSV